MKKSVAILLSSLILFNISHSANAALVQRSGGLVYDTELNVTWIADFNFFGTQASLNPNLINEIISASPTVPSQVGSYSSYSSADSTGTYSITTDDFLVRNGDSSLMTWYGAQAWASQLNYQGFNDWRVAGAFITDDGQPSTELRHLWEKELGITSANLSGNSSEVSKFYNGIAGSIFDTGFGYWLGDNIDSIGQNGYISSSVLSSSAIGGASTVINRWNVMLVRNGDVPAIPEPENYAMFLVGLGLLSLVTKRKDASN